MEDSAFIRSEFLFHTAKKKKNDVLTKDGHNRQVDEDVVWPNCVGQGHEDDEQDTADDEVDNELCLKQSCDNSLRGQLCTMENRYFRETTGNRKQEKLKLESVHVLFLWPSKRYDTEPGTVPSCSCQEYTNTNQNQK